MTDGVMIGVMIGVIKRVIDGVTLRSGRNLIQSLLALISPISSVRASNLSDASVGVDIKCSVIVPVLCSSIVVVVVTVLSSAKQAVMVLH